MFIDFARNTEWPKGVRVAALKYLALLPGTVRYDLLHPYKTRVLKELAKVLDDPKRAVRKEAVIARYGIIIFSVIRLFIMSQTERTGQFLCKLVHHTAELIFLVRYKYSG